MKGAVVVSQEREVISRASAALNKDIAAELGLLVLVLKKCNFHFWRFLKSQPRTNNDHFTLMEQTKTPFSPS